jgi:hypothetical protein
MVTEIGTVLINDGLMLVIRYHDHVAVLMYPEFMMALFGKRK